MKDEHAIWLITFHDAFTAAVGCGSVTLERIDSDWRLKWYSPKVSWADRHYDTFAATETLTPEVMATYLDAASFGEHRGRRAKMSYHAAIKQRAEATQ